MGLATGVDVESLGGAGDEGGDEERSAAEMEPFLGRPAFFLGVSAEEEQGEGEGGTAS